MSEKGKRRLFDIERKKLALILFTETGCMVRAEDLTNEDVVKMEFVLFAEECGDMSHNQFNINFLHICNEIMKRMGFITQDYSLGHIYEHRRWTRLHLN